MRNAVRTPTYLLSVEWVPAIPLPAVAWSGPKLIGAAHSHARSTASCGPAHTCWLPVCAAMATQRKGPSEDFAAPIVDSAPVA